MSITTLDARSASGGLVWFALLSLLTFASGQSLAASSAAKLGATAKLARDTGKIAVTGKTKGMAIGSQVSVYDASNHMLLFSGRTDAKAAFVANLPMETVPCMLQVESGGMKTLVKVSGADASCAATPSCMIGEADRSLEEGMQASFGVLADKSKKSGAVEYRWNMGDGTPELVGPSVSHTFPYAGLYRVVLQGDNGQGVCEDDTLVSVSPPQGANPRASVKESPRPANGSAMPGENGENDANAYVVFPFEDFGMQGGSQINIPYNPLIPYNALNAQVIKKIASKPLIVDPSELSVFYSAASNPLDPAGAGSINSTSQNLFRDGSAGANFDPVATTCTSGCPNAKTETVLIDGHDYVDAAIRKSEFWDRTRQPNAAKLLDNAGKPAPQPQRGISNADNANAYTPAKPLTLPDQGLRGYVDKGEGIRAMPGIRAPYQANDPQPLDYSASQQAFVGQNIPASDIDDQGRTNPYPLFRVEAKDASGKVKAATDAVYTAASETGCRECHTKGKKGSDDQVWRTPVHESELLNSDGTPGPATGAGDYPLGKMPTPIALSGNLVDDFKKYGWGPAVHNRFDNVKFDDPNYSVTAKGIDIPRDQNGLRTDRVAESRWLKPDGTTSPTNPAKDPAWKLQIRLKFKEAKDFGDDSWQNQEKAALFNTLVVHDYMTKYVPKNETTGVMSWVAVFAEYADDVYSAARNANNICAAHHWSTLKGDVGADQIRYPRNYSDYTRTLHAFHGKMQAYKREVTAAESLDGAPHKQGDLIRDERGHPKMFGGRGWDSQHNDDEGIPLSKDANGNFTVKTAAAYDPARNNWAPDMFPAHPLGEPMLPTGENIPMEKNCLTCHTGRTEKSYRDIHHAAGLKCDNCHGDMMAVGNVFPNEIYDGNLLTGGTYGVDDPGTLTPADFRRQWLDEPDCGSCHVGDANLAKDGDAGLRRYYSAGALKQGWKDGDPAMATIFPVNARFAVTPTKETRPEKLTVNGKTQYVDRQVSQALYRKSADVHGSGANGVLTCSTCHGGSHAIWPNQDPNANDNVTSLQLQGYPGNIVECSTCHIKDDFKTGLVATDGGASGLGVAQGVRDGSVVTPASPKAFLAGPHGMHPIDDPYWYQDAPGASGAGGWHNDMAKKPGPDGEDQCAACHGQDHMGTRLSRTLVDREFVYNGKKIKVAAGTVIGCTLCHKDSRVSDAPKGKAKTHPPAQPEPVTASASTGGGGGHH